MASLTASLKLGTGSASNLIKSATSIEKAVQNYQDQVQALNYANSAYTDDAFSSYQSYLQGRIDALNTAGGISNASKALTLQKTLEGAMKSNISASITRENIQIMAGNASLQDKYGLIVNQFQRASANGDFTLAQTLEKQAYDVNQSIQYQAQQAADAAATLARAGNGSTTGTSGVAYQNSVVANLKEGIKYLNGLAQNASEKELNQKMADYAVQAKPVLQALGVDVHPEQGQQPNYFDVIHGISGAIYNAMVLKAQAEAPIDPLVSRTDAAAAKDYLVNGTEETLAGKLTVLEIQQAQIDPNMFTYDNTSGKYVRDIQSGYQYITVKGVKSDGTIGDVQQLVPQYSYFASTTSGREAFNKVNFLTPTETTMMTKLGLNFTENYQGKSVGNTLLDKNGKPIAGTTGEGVQVSVSENTPQFLKNILGEKGIGNMFTDQNGFLTFKAGASGGQGDSYYTLAQDGRGLAGLYERLPDGTTRLAGGDYGFNASAVDLLINKGQQVQYQVQLAQQQAQQKLLLSQQQAQQQLKIAPPAPPAPPPAPSQAQSLQPTRAPQMPTYNPQGNNYNPQPATFNPQQTVSGPKLNQSGSGGIRLGSSFGSGGVRL